MKLLAFGRVTDTDVSSNDSINDFLEVDLLHSVDLYSQRAEGEPIELDGLRESDFIELIDDDGYIKITTLGALISDYNPTNNRSDDDQEPIIMNELVVLDDTTRGGLKKFFRKSKIFRAKDEMANFTVRELTEKLENKFMKEEGVFECSNPLLLGNKVDGIKPTDDPILLLIHGTAVNTKSTFGGLISEGDQSVWQSLLDKYGNNIYAVEHKTLSKGPLENALMVAETLPKNAILHLVSGSRGGLIGEILCQSMSDSNGEKGFTKNEIAAFKEYDNRASDLQNIKRLNEIFKEKNIIVERFVRVACPSAGTTLASGRLDLYFNIVLNVIGLIPALKGPVYGFLKSFLLTVVAKKADVTLLPGLEAMMPSSPLIKVLNNQAKLINSELVVISGDAVPRGGIFKTIKVKLIDLFFREENDFIVNTGAMYGGIPRSRTNYFFHQHQTTNHFRYFSNPPTQRAILIGLKGEASSKTGFRPIEIEKTKEVLSIIQNRGIDEHAPIAYIIPGIMGSKLRADGKKVWVNIARLPFGAFDKLKITNPNVEAYDLMGSAYADFVEFLTHTHNVVCFPYDWRLSVEDAANSLAENIQNKLKATDKPIHIIAHSLGGLVVHLFYNNHKDIWNELMERDGSKVLLLGSPLKGSHIIPQVMLRSEHFFKLLHRMDITNTQKDLLAILMKFPGILELLPANTNNGKAIDGINYFDSSLYDLMDQLDDKFVAPFKKDISNAQKITQKIESDPIKGKNVFYIAGKDSSTPHKLVLDNDGKRGDFYRLLGTSRGDGRVTWDSILNANFDFKPWYMNASHGAMCSTKQYFGSILDILRYGKTNLLPTEPIIDRGVEEDFEIYEEEPIALFGDAEIEASFLGIDQKTLPSKKLPTVKIQVTHGDLGNAQFPVAVGHHNGDGIVSAERVVDEYMGNRLKDYYYSGLYPGEIQSSLVVLNHTGYFEGAVIVGLGDFGELTKGQLEETFAYSLVDLVMKEVERYNSNTDINKVIPIIGVSTLLIGSRYAGMSISDSIISLLNGLALANQKLATLKNCPVNQISTIEFIELYEDRAISAAKVIRRLLSDGYFGEFETAQPILSKVSGRRQKISNLDMNEWWFRLQITEEIKEANTKEPPLKFVSITDKALSEVRILPMQRILIEKLLQSSVSGSRFRADLAKTLYSLIVPNELRDFAADKRDVILLLDKKSAQYPWELLHDPDEVDKKPLSTQSGMIRQLASSRFNRMIKYTVGNTAYVLGNPKTSDKFSDLPGALIEAKNVSAILGNNGFDVVNSFEESSEQAIIKLFKTDYKVIHIAGHGVVDLDNPLKSGVVLDNGIYITPSEIRKMNKVPEFVFINCCHSGDMSADSNQLENMNILAANLGTEFIEKGVKAVVVAGWAVDDSAAKTFAQELYNELLDGEKFGQAVTKARSITYQRHSNTNTWGAYQCYGDQFYELTSGKSRAKKVKIEYVHPKEALIEIRNIRSSSGVRSSGEADRLVKKLNNIIENVPVYWLKRTDISEALGSAFYELREYDQSLHYFNLLRNSSGDEYTLLGMRSLSNLYMKLALFSIRHKKQTAEEKAKVKKYVSEAELLAEWLLKLGATSYRYSLKGGNYKRKALLSSNKVRIVAALKHSADNYKKAVDVLISQKNNDNYYPLLNWLTIIEILQFYGEAKPKELTKRNNIIVLLTKAKQSRSEITHYNNGFWNTVSEASFLGYDLFEVSNNQHKAEEIIEQMIKVYNDAWQVGGSVRKSENIIGHFSFVLTCLENVPRQSMKKSTHEKLENTINTFRTLYIGLSNVLVK